VKVVLVPQSPAPSCTSHAQATKHSLSSQRNKHTGGLSSQQRSTLEKNVGKQVWHLVLHGDVLPVVGLGQFCLPPPYSLYGAQQASPRRHLSCFLKTFARCDNVLIDELNAGVAIQKLPPHVAI
jgi:hypothetical protein